MLFSMLMISTQRLSNFSGAYIHEFYIHPHDIVKCDPSRRTKQLKHVLRDSRSLIIKPDVGRMTLPDSHPL